MEKVAPFHSWLLLTSSLRWGHWGFILGVSPVQVQAQDNLAQEWTAFDMIALKWAAQSWVASHTGQLWFFPSLQTTWFMIFGKPANTSPCALVSKTRHHRQAAHFVVNRSSLRISFWVLVTDDLGFNLFGQQVLFCRGGVGRLLSSRHRRFLGSICLLREW